MPRPQIIRADTIDLQDQKAPSAQDHTRQPTHPSALGAGPAAPHQAETVREAAVEASEEQHRSPRVSAEWSDEADTTQQDLIEEDKTASLSSSSTASRYGQQDGLAIAQNDTLTGSASEDAEMADAEGDDSLDDDMMDKISSSPSIDDGGYPFPQTWPERVDSLSPSVTPQNSPHFIQGSSERSSSPFVETPLHYPLRPFLDQLDPRPYQSSRHNLSSEYPTSKCGASDSVEFVVDYENENSLTLYPDDTINTSASSCEDEERDHLTPLRSDNTDVAKIYDENFDVGAAEDYLAVQVGLDYDRSLDKYDEGIMTIPYESSEEDDGHELPFPDDPRLVDSGWGGDCLQESEDIDFEFVYALHTFVATVEGQANATKGDTMVLLDDSNSYWWLVRVVKDSSIGYLPAEHIETPTERLARLNKHRNIDLSATMLGDQADKPKNPLKKAIRRRNAKAVQFAPPTYFEASENDYSSNGEDGESEYFVQQQSVEVQQSDLDDDEISAVEPLSVRSQTRDAKGNIAVDDDELTLTNSSEVARTSEETFDGKSEGNGKSRNGTVRNTDSFFKDDSVETRKITITPALFRDDSSTSTRASNDSKELRQTAIPDKVESEAALDKSKDDRKKKEKKSGLLGNIFRRKDKKSKLQEDDVDELIYGKKMSSEDVRESPDLDDSSQPGEQTPIEAPPQQRQPSKLQKQSRQEHPPSNAKQTDLVAEGKAESQQVPAPERAPPAIASVEPSMRLVQPDAQPNHGIPVQQIRDVSPELARAPSASDSRQEEPRSGSAFSRIMRSKSGTNSESKPEKVKKAKSRVELDDFDSSANTSPVGELAPEPILTPVHRPIPGAFPDSYISIPAKEKLENSTERLSESPVQVSPVDMSRSNPPALMIDTSSQEEPPSPVSSPSPELVDIEEGRDRKAVEGSVSASTATPTWSDTHLRTFFDDDGDIKDLLIVVYDKSGVVPAGPNHPIVGNLFKEENAKLTEITTASILSC
ncbi:MAG: hypothetical protein M1818_005670 [Claussenomyces sp. TS43310]|nr:MAG: hypothetical protein M1818_005670 [Claussenomyces sp. TS43310]